MPAERKIYSVVERDIFTCRKNEVSSVRNDLRYGLHVNTRISANKSKSEMLKDEDLNGAVYKHLNLERVSRRAIKRHVTC